MDDPIDSLRAIIENRGDSGCIHDVLNALVDVSSIDYVRDCLDIIEEGRRLRNGAVVMGGEPLDHWNLTGGLCSACKKRKNDHIFSQWGAACPTDDKEKRR